MEAGVEAPATPLPCVMGVCYQRATLGSRAQGRLRRGGRRDEEVDEDQQSDEEGERTVTDDGW